MYLIDTNVISELRKQAKANPGVQTFFQQIANDQIPVYISVVTLGELRRGIELIRHRDDLAQAQVLEKWLSQIIENYANHILDFGATESQVGKVTCTAS